MKFEIKDKDIKKILDFLHIKTNYVRKPIAFLESLIERMNEHHIFLIAGGIAFNILLYLIPLLLVAMYIINLSFEQENVLIFIEKNLNQLIPSVPMLKNFIKNILSEVSLVFDKSSIFGIIGILSLLWLSSTLLSSLRSGLNTIFQISTPKVFIIYKLQDILLILALAVLILILFYLNPLVSITQRYIAEFLPFEFNDIFKKLYVSAFSIFNSFLLLYLLFRFVPNQRLPRKLRLISIISSMVLMELSRNLFAWYISGVSAYGKFYGTYVIIASMALWVYYLTFILLFSAELGKFIYDAIYGNTMSEYLRTLKISPKVKKVPK